MEINQQKKQNNEILGELHPREVQLILLIRTRFRFGEILVNVRDGLPYRILKAFESTDFD